MNYYKTHEHVFHITATVLVAVIVIWLGWDIFVPTSAVETNRRLHVGSGQSLTAIADVLGNQGLVRSATVFKYYVLILGWGRNLKAGDYTIPAGSTLYDIASQIAGGSGSSTDITVFIPEGYNIWEIDKRLADSKLIKEGQFASAYISKEGYLFPDTYRFKPGSLLSEIEQKMETNGQDKIANLLGTLSLPARNRIITIASIIEKEARTESDMHLVSGVIANRLKNKMKLEIDATVAYGTCLRQFNFSIPTIEKDCAVNLVGVGVEIKKDSAYNTYTRSGLPPHPISNPGLTSIESALNPTGNYFYYLSTRDGSQIIFERTAEQHQIDRQKYLGL
jgi:UPF0755 protein